MLHMAIPKPAFVDYERSLRVIGFFVLCLFGYIQRAVSIVISLETQTTNVFLIF